MNLPFHLVEDKETSLFTQDVRGFFHFASNLRNIKDVRKALNTLKNQPEYAALVDQEGDAVQDLFERTSGMPNLLDALALSLHMRDWGASIGT